MSSITLCLDRKRDDMICWRRKDHEGNHYYTKIGGTFAQRKGIDLEEETD